MVRYLDPPPSLFFGPPAELVRVRSVSPDQLQLRQLLLQLVGQEPLRAVAVVQAGGVNASAEYQPTGVHEQVALPARESLGPVVATFWTADTGGFHDLAVQDCPAGIAISTLRFAYRRSKSVVGLLQAPVPPPLAKVVVDRLPGRVLSGEHPPGAAAPQQVKDGVSYAPGGSLRGTSAPFQGREEGLQEGPFGVGKVGGVGSSASAGHGDLRDRGYTYCPRW
jgi:hypothetical protein